ncbi:hypothetical protein FEP39_00760 [Burkholderia multivorans]|nr:hypothetical protein [Burkholderia multivorans]MDR9056923.1 hypothetical protein [Burkholderia multivorans]MDR9060884.1 hypothetical protein [Burkholderia multivorans]MDR9067555.1 hypothetical protein [Burkholderia multivorans]MDR9073720.1 hypothetical protein [Burkholderia multivorans]
MSSSALAMKMMRAMPRAQHADIQREAAEKQRQWPVDGAKHHRNAPGWQFDTDVSYWGIPIWSLEPRRPAYEQTDVAGRA